jgi:phosphoglycolate phosphatase-like HAD superfamily hydrolase
LQDILYGVERNYRHYNEREVLPIRDFGYFFSVVAENKEKFIYKQDKMKEMLKRLKAQGIFLFIVTNSHWEYGNLTMTHAYGEVIPGLLIDSKLPFIQGLERSL